jgi:hypothetical protein
MRDVVVPPLVGIQAAWQKDAEKASKDAKIRLRPIMGLDLLDKFVVG